MDIIVLAVLLVLAILLVVFIIRRKVIGAMSTLLKLAFPAFLLLALSALFVPQIYLTVADFTLTQSGTLDSIRSIDKTISPLLRFQENIFNGIGDLLSSGQQETEQSDQTGYLEENLYSKLIDIYGGVLRIIALIISIAGMAVVIYLSYTVESSGELYHMRNKVKELENRIKLLESRFPGQTS